MTSFIQLTEYLYDKYSFEITPLVILMCLILIINWGGKYIFPYYFRKSKLEKMDEYKDKYIKLNNYKEKTDVIHGILEEEYGYVFLKEKNVSKQKIMIFLLYSNLCQTIKEAKKIATYLVFSKPQNVLIFNLRFTLSRILSTSLLSIICFALFLYINFCLKQVTINLEQNILGVLLLVSYGTFSILMANIFIVLADSISSYRFFKKNSDTMKKISIRLSKLSNKEIIDSE